MGYTVGMMTKQTAAKAETKLNFFCAGSVRGNCGHKHATAEAAARCQRRDSKGCKSQGGYSDRKIRDSQGGEYFAHWASATDLEVTKVQ